jgi:hypothetical protein
MNFAKIYERYGAPFRRRRMKLFESLFPPSYSVVDLGGTDWNWSFVSRPYRITLVNIDREALRPQAEFSATKLRVQADAMRTPFRDGQFDVAFSNSVIEHLHTWERQKAFAAEVRRIAKYYFIQTPYRYFPIEPHVMVPGVQFLPKPAALWASRWLSPRGWLESDPSDLIEDMAHVRLLTRRELGRLFPDAAIYVERFWGLIKSLIAVRSPRFDYLRVQARNRIFEDTSGGERR